jgi:hypothetical protein
MRPWPARTESGGVSAPAVQRTDAKALDGIPRADLETVRPHLRRLVQLRIEQEIANDLFEARRRTILADVERLAVSSA